MFPSGCKVNPMTVDKDPYDNNVPFLMPGKYFRLRINRTIVGYLREADNGQCFYSSDNASWCSLPIEYEHQDRFSGVLDCNRAMIFEYDVVRVKKTPDLAYTPRGWVVWDRLARKMVISLLEENQIVEFPRLPPEAPFRDDLRVISQLYATEDDGLI